MNRKRSVVVGIDVGGPQKGFHAVAQRDGSYLDKFKAADPEQVLSWCEKVNASIIGIDAPCRWGSDNKGKTRGRQCEHELAKERIRCFATPGEERAKSTGFYGWMVNGALLYQVLASRYPLYCGHKITGPLCFETFPHAVACALAGHIVSAQQKRIVRSELLRKAGVDTGELTNIDYTDAALCALTANCLLTGKIKKYGKAEDGFIIVPGEALK